MSTVLGSIFNDFPKYFSLPKHCRMWQLTSVNRGGYNRGMSKKQSKASGGHVTPRRMFYLPADLADRVTALGKVNDRAMNREIARAVEHWIDLHNSKVKPENRV